MNIFLIIGVVVAGAFVFLYIAMYIKTLIPSPKFKPAKYEPVPPDYWPAHEFQTSAPEQQGMDSSKLMQIYDFYQKAHKKNPAVTIDSISIYRNGYCVADYCFNPLYEKDDLHVIHSVTKSIMSALIGIAIEQGHIESINLPFVDFFPDRQSVITDTRMREVRLKDLLSMQTGIRSRDYALYRWEGLFEMQEHDDWVAHIMSLPLDAEPGIRFDYSNMSSFLLSAIIHEATGEDALSFAQKNLFAPLGIKHVRWEKSPQGYQIGYARMWLRPDDMAKIGMLYLQKGKWAGRQIIPAGWIRESLTPHAFPKNLVDVLDKNGEKDKKLTTIQWRAANFVRPFSDGYGYQWWLDKDGSFSAIGVSGQYIMVVPQKNLVVVITNSSHGLGVFFPRKILDKMIVPAVKSDSPISPNPAAQQALSVFAQPPVLEEQASGVPALPQKALDVSGDVYLLEKNYWNYDNFKLDFNSNSDHAVFTYSAKVHDKAGLQVGLDGTYRFTDTQIGRFAARGKWTTENSFEIDIQQIGYSAPVKFILTFIDGRIQIDEISITGTHQYAGKIR